MRPQIKLLLWAAIGTLSLAGCAAQKPDDALATPDAGPVSVRKSANDDRSYRYLELPNRLRVLLVSDPATEKAAAAMAVFRGSQHEPAERQGLAHFLEHMLFIQTHTYPEIDGFQTMVRANGGSSNAYTALDHTNYFFDVRPAAFDEALDRFAHFFIDPVLSPEYAAREKNAVHSEYQMQSRDDGWRGHMVGKQLVNPAHPASRFTIGSLETLDGDIHEDLLQFFEAALFGRSDGIGRIVGSAPGRVGVAGDTAVRTDPQPGDRRGPSGRTLLPGRAAARTVAAAFGKGRRQDHIQLPGTIHASSLSQQAGTVHRQSHRS